MTNNRAIFNFGENVIREIFIRENLVRDIIVVSVNLSLYLLLVAFVHKTHDPEFERVVPHGLSGCGPVAVLVVHRRPHPHQRRHLK